MHLLKRKKISLYPISISLKCCKYFTHIVDVLCTSRDLTKTECKQGYLDSFQRPTCPDLIFKPNFHCFFPMTSRLQMEYTEMNKRFKVYSILKVTFSPNIWSGNMHIS